jgi:hypothetical protein
MHDRSEEAKKVLISLHKKDSDPTHSFAQKELFVIKKQIDYENQNRLSVWQALKKRSLQKRFLIGFLSMSCTQCSGLLVVLSELITLGRNRISANIESVSIYNLSIARILSFHGRSLWFHLVGPQRNR